MATKQSAKLVRQAMTDADNISIENKMLYLARIVNNMDSKFVSTLMDEDDGTKVTRDEIIKKIITLETYCEGLIVKTVKKSGSSK